VGARHFFALVTEQASYLLGAPASSRLTVAAMVVGVTDMPARDGLPAGSRRSQQIREKLARTQLLHPPCTKTLISV